MWKVNKINLIIDKKVGQKWKKTIKPEPNNLTNDDKFETNKDANMEISEIARKVNNLECKKI